MKISSVGRSWSSSISATSCFTPSSTTYRSSFRSPSSRLASNTGPIAKTGIEAAIPLAAVASLVIAPLSNHVFTGVLHFTEAREGHQRYGIPYDWHILLPAYLTFFEPVIAAFVIGYAVRRQLPSTPLLQFGITAALVVALKGPVFAALLNIQYAGTAPSTAILSYAQFTFETVALGILTAATLQMSLKEISTKDFRLSDHDEAAST